MATETAWRSHQYHLPEHEVRPDPPDCEIVVTIRTKGDKEVLLKSKVQEMKVLNDSERTTLAALISGWFEGVCH
jgi:hypothetical protein